jgi:16S rRNA (adenine1518-N6/adenine1519-N6)-dimethyltransferase
MAHIPRKRFGQHFLTDAAVIASILEAIRPRPADLMVEIGPGLGALTRPLLDCVAKLHVVEIDRDIVAHLARAFPLERLAIHQADALQFDFGALGAEQRIVGNLPYNISTPLLFHLAGYARSIRDIHVMLQEEVVARMTADRGQAEYGRLSVMLQHRFSVERLLSVSPQAFRPPPKVDSAVVRMRPFASPDHCPETAFATLVKHAFMQRRKTLRNSLRDFLREQDFKALEIDPTARAQNLAVADYVRMANYVDKRARN